MPFPQTRLRRLRATHALRGLVRETRLDPGDFVYPMFVAHGIDRREPIPSMPGIDHLSIAHAVDEAAEAKQLGIPAVLLFGLPAAKDEEGSGAWDDEGIIQLATRAIKEAHPDLLVIADLCLCEYTSHGHCGVVRTDGQRRQRRDTRTSQQDRSLPGPRRRRHHRPERHDGRPRRRDPQQRSTRKISRTSPIMAYSAKFASAFYGPFREAADSAPAFGDRRAYQMDPANGNEAIREARLDVEEGADIVMVKPALPYLDLIRRIKVQTAMPLAAYNVSGEYAMLKAAAAAGYLDEQAAVLETLTGIRRAGADIIITYHAKDAARWLQ